MYPQVQASAPALTPCYPTGVWAPCPQIYVSGSVPDLSCGSSAAGDVDAGSRPLGMHIRGAGLCPGIGSMEPGIQEVETSRVLFMGQRGT